MAPGRQTFRTMASKPFTFIGGNDDFLVARLGKSRFEELAAGLEDEFSSEIINGAAGTVGEVERAVSGFVQAVNTLPMFGGRKVVWFKDVAFLGDTVTGRAEGTLSQVEVLKETLASVDPGQVVVLVTASPVDKRRAFAKWLDKSGGVEWVAAVGDRGGDPAALATLAAREADSCGVGISPGAVEMLMAKTGGNTRVMAGEIRKLATYLGGEGGTIDEENVAELVPESGEGDFFEAAEAFFSLDLSPALNALRRHFFSGHESRGLLATLQKRNSLLIQLRVLLDSGEIKTGFRGVEKNGFERASAAHAAFFQGAEEKNSHNVFTQNPWYLGKLAEKLRGLSLKRLIDFQQEFLAAYSEIARRPREEEEVMREVFIRCLSR